MAAIETAYAGGQAVAPGTGDQHAAFAAALVATDKAHAGYTLAQAVYRIAAAGAPLWLRRIATGDLTWCVRKPSTPRGKARGTVHVFAHRAERGAVEHCRASGDNAHGACNATTKSLGDKVARWRCDDDANGKADTRLAVLDAKALAQAFATAHAAQVEYLRGKGHTLAEIAALPSVAQRIEAVEAVAGRPTAEAFAATMLDKPATTRKASTPRKSSTNKRAAKPATK